MESCPGKPDVVPRQQEDFEDCVRLYSSIFQDVFLCEDFLIQYKVWLIQEEKTSIISCYCLKFIQGNLFKDQN